MLNSSGRHKIMQCIKLRISHYRSAEVIFCWKFHQPMRLSPAAHRHPKTGPTEPQLSFFSPFPPVIIGDPEAILGLFLWFGFFLLSDPLILLLLLKALDMPQIPSSVLFREFSIVARFATRPHLRSPSSLPRSVYLRGLRSNYSTGMSIQML